LILYWFSHEHLEQFLSIKPCLFLYAVFIGRSAQRPKAHVKAKNKRDLTGEEIGLKQQEYINTVENLDYIALFFT
jgi:hypothetical protein